MYSDVIPSNHIAIENKIPSTEMNVYTQSQTTERSIVPDFPRKKKKDPSSLIFKCNEPECNREYHQKSKLIAHLRTHIGFKPFICEVCGKAFNYRWNLKSHSWIHNLKKPYKCYLLGCDYAFKSSGSLKAHLQNHSKSQVSFYCPYCSLNFTHYKSINTHIELKHHISKINNIFDIKKEIKDPLAKSTSSYILENCRTESTTITLNESLPSFTKMDCPISNDSSIDKQLMKNISTFLLETHETNNLFDIINTEDRDSIVYKESLAIIRDVILALLQSDFN